MKKTITTLLLASLTIIGTSAFIIKNSSGIQGYAGSPGESTCSNCHSGGTSAASGITITSVPDFSLNTNSELEYMQDSLYTIRIEVAASGFTRYGFASQILTASNINSGTLQTPGTGVKFLNAGSKRTAVHTTPKLAAANTPTVFIYQWKAPKTGDPATIYAIANAVNNNGTTSGDFIISPVNLPLVAAPTPTVEEPNTVGLKENASSISQVSVFPNPASDITNISYFLSQSKTISIQLIDIKGQVIKELYKQEDAPGFHTQILNLNGVASGVYFIKTNANQQKVSQKLITVQ
ncbi:hypothetical protein CNR22_11010 [Sphingobacteriaceae bacterium]|nr:hypothetical protein CNR22_11010 [Sphingobacteriaceae bacterium]